RPFTAGTHLCSYGIPFALAGCLVLVFFSRSTYKGGEVKSGVAVKHTLHMAQVFAFCYQQRHPRWAPRPWTQVGDLMVAHFGQEQPTFRKMIAANPRAVLEHVAWNVSLVPNGLQVLLFNASSGRTNPDYPAPKLHRAFPLYLSLACAAIWVAALVSW